MILCSVQSPTGEAPVYVCPLGRQATITTGSVCNISASAVTVSVSVVPFGAAVDNTHRVVSNYSIAAGDTLSLDDYIAGSVLAAGDLVSVNASAGTAIDVVLSGTVQ